MSYNFKEIPKDAVALLVHKDSCIIDGDHILIIGGGENTVIKLKKFIKPKGIDLEDYHIYAVPAKDYEHIPFFEENK